MHSYYDKHAEQNSLQVTLRAGNGQQAPHAQLAGDRLHVAKSAAPRPRTQQLRRRRKVPNAFVKMQERKLADIVANSTVR